MRELAMINVNDTVEEYCYVSPNRQLMKAFMTEMFCSCFCPLLQY